MQEATTQRLIVLVREFELLAGLVRGDTAKALSEADPIEVVKHYDKLRIAMDQIKTARKALEELEEDLSKVQIPTLFMNRSLKTVNIEGVGRVTISYRWSASMIDKDKGMKWLDDNGHGGLIQPTVNSSSLAAFAKDQATEGDDLPEDLFKVGQLAYTSITKA
jgi:hypothetical protein